MRPHTRHNHNFDEEKHSRKCGGQDEFDIPGPGFCFLAWAQNKSPLILDDLNRDLVFKGHVASEKDLEWS